MRRIRIAGLLACIVFAVAVSVGSTLAATPVEDSLDIVQYGADGLPIERWRAYGDFNLDGMVDLIVSEDVAHARVDGLQMTIFLRDSTGNLNYYDAMFGDPRGLCVEKCSSETRIWSYEYLQHGCGMLSFSVVSDAGLIPGGKIEIRPGQTGGRVSNALLKAIYENSDASFKLQRSHIVDGKVTWSDEQYSVTN